MGQPRDVNKMHEREIVRTFRNAIMDAVLREREACSQAMYVIVHTRRGITPEAKEAFREAGMIIQGRESPDLDSEEGS